MQIGPTIIELEEQKKEVDCTRVSLKHADPKDVLLTTRLGHFLKDAQGLADKAEKRSASAKSYYQSVVLSTARSVVGCLAADRLRYAEALMAQMQAQPGEKEEFDNLMELFDKLASTVALKPGDEAEAKLPGEARLRRVKVIDRSSPATHQPQSGGDYYNVSVWTVVQVSHMKYEEGFETSARHIVQVPRAHLYLKKGAKERQKLSEVSRTNWAQRKAAVASEEMQHRKSGRHSTTECGRPLFRSSTAHAGSCFADKGPPSTSLEYLMLLYADAERAVPLLRALAASVQRSVLGSDSAEGDNEKLLVKVASLKGLHRAIEKCLQKYDVCGARASIIRPQ